MILIKNDKKSDLYLLGDTGDPFDATTVASTERIFPTTEDLTNPPSSGELNNNKKIR